jgi:hypothetical protein
MPVSACAGERTFVSVLDQVRKFVTRLSPEAVCDDCIADKLGLSARQPANHNTRELAGTDGFVRGKDRCSICESEKLVTRKS